MEAAGTHCGRLAFGRGRTSRTGPGPGARKINLFHGVDSFRFRDLLRSLLLDSANRDDRNIAFAMSGLRCLTQAYQMLLLLSRAQKLRLNFDILRRLINDHYYALRVYHNFKKEFEKTNIPEAEELMLAIEGDKMHIIPHDEKKQLRDNTWNEQVAYRLSVIRSAVENLCNAPGIKENFISSRKENIDIADRIYHKKQIVVLRLAPETGVVGAGLVQVYTAEENRTVIQQLLPEAIVSCYNGYDPEQLSGLLKWADTVCIGCGLGTGDVSEKILLHTLREADAPCIVDADGLNLLSRHMDVLRGSRIPLILTPHMKEMSRLTGISVTEIADRRMDIVREFTDRYPAVCVLKDSRTIVKSKGNHPFLNLAGNSGMAKAGAGDVLAGVITGLSAQGMSAYESAALGVYLHACGGDEAWEEKGSYSMLARDLIAGIGRCMKNNEENYRRDTENETA